MKYDLMNFAVKNDGMFNRGWYIVNTIGDDIFLFTDGSIGTWESSKDETHGFWPTEEAATAFLDHLRYCNNPEAKVFESEKT